MFVGAGFALDAARKIQRDAANRRERLLRRRDKRDRHNFAMRKYLTATAEMLGEASTRFEGFAHVPLADGEAP